MIKTKAAADPNARLKSFAERIDRLEEEKKAISGDVKDVYTEVKSAGYNAKALRKVLADRRRKSDDELAADMELYRAALGVPGATYRAVAEQLGVTKSKLQRLVPRNQNGTDHDPATGEVIEEGSAPVAASEKEVPSAKITVEVESPKLGRDGEASAEERAASASSSPPDSDVGIPMSDRACGGVEGHAPVQSVGEPILADGPPLRRMDDAVLDPGAISESGLETSRVSSPGPQDPIWDELAKVKRDLDEAFRRARVPA